MSRSLTCLLTVFSMVSTAHAQDRWQTSPRGDHGRAFATSDGIGTLKGNASRQFAIDPDEEHLVGAEILGRAIVYSITYEHVSRSGAGFGLGVAVWGADTGSSIVFLPIYGSWRPGRREHRPYVALGATFVGTTHGGAQTFDTNLSGAFGHVTIGYEIKTGERELIRPTLSYLFAHQVRLWWPGITFARRF